MRSTLVNVHFLNVTLSNKDFANPHVSKGDAAECRVPQRLLIEGCVVECVRIGACKSSKVFPALLLEFLPFEDSGGDLGRGHLSVASLLVAYPRGDDSLWANNNAERRASQAPVRHA